MTGMASEDARLVAAAVAGEAGAFRALYDRYRPAVVRAAEAFAELDPDEVDDVVQESFVRAFRALPRLREPARFGPWLLTIARNRCMTHLARRQLLHRTLEELDREIDAELLPPPVHDATEVAVVRDLIAGLPDGPEKETVRLFYVEGELSARQIAQRQGVGKSAVTMRLERFRARVKRELMARILGVRGGA